MWLSIDRHKVLTLFFALFFVLSFKKPSAQILMVILALGGLLYYKAHKPPMHLSPFKWLIASMFAMFLVVWPNLFVGGDLDAWHYNLRSLNMPSVYVLGVVALLCLHNVPFRLNARFLFYSMAFACFFNGGLAFVQRVFLGVGRVVGFSTVVGFVTLTSMALFGCFIYALHTDKRQEKWLFSVAMLTGFLVMLFSATRSASIAFAITFLALCVFLRRTKQWRYMGLMALCFGGLFALNQTLEQHALLHAARTKDESFSQDLRLFAQKNPDSSIGLRLARWQEALAIAKLSPLIGMSLSTKCRRLDEILALSHSYRKADQINCAEKYDNEFFNTLAHRGVLGLAALAWFLCVLWRFFAKRKDIIGVFMLSMLVFYVSVGIGFDPFDFFIEGSFLVGMVVMGAIAERLPTTQPLTTTSKDPI
ncbi:O-antigen polymerase [Helicobacter ailurogastricus]|uniref:O-antigen ligase family protein n=1 Tax=Helicobacter ailurogastricus TaxID=1578720 RepID=UPI00244D8239|nr:O-antigen ligase family protein [Helicobacter ailurogastricus]GMB90268.1 O-antigen polymerase [Helicobacter ailurogastricus]